jgi:hypothetical protein
MDIGNPALPGFAEEADGTYTIEGGGVSLGYRTLRDEFFYIYNEISGNFAIEAFPDPWGPNGYGGPMIRQSVDEDAPHASALVATVGRGTNATWGSFFPHFRSSKGGATTSDGDYEPGGYSDGHTGKVRLERMGNTFRFYTQDSTGAWVLRRTEIVPMRDPVLVGLAVNGNHASNAGLYDFSEVVIEEFPATVERILPTEELTPGATLSPITLTAKVRSGQTSNLSVTEIPPRDGTVSNVNASAGTATLNSDGTISWELPAASGQATLTYNLVLGPRTAATWHGTFTMDGVANNFLGGDAILPRVPQWITPDEPIAIDPNKPNVVQVESGMPITDGHWALMVFPQLDNGIIAQSNSGTAAHALEFVFNVPTAGTYYMAAFVRGEDGNSDSFRTELGVPPGGPTENTVQYWTISGGSVWAFDWISSSADTTLGTPAQAKRPFEFVAGDNYFYIGNREDDAKIDFLVVTADPSFSPGAYDFITGVEINPLDELEGFTELGVFDGSMDITNDAIANLGRAGGAGYNPSTGQYMVIGSGNDIWGTDDNFHFMYKEVNGDFSLEATIDADAGISSNVWVKVALMARDELTSGSVNSMILMRPDELLNFQWRPEPSVASLSTAADLRPLAGSHDRRVKLERVGNLYSAYYTAPGSTDWILLDDEELPNMTDSIFVGLATTSHEVNALSIGVFSDLILTTSGGPVPVNEWSLY